MSVSLPRENPTQRMQTARDRRTIWRTTHRTCARAAECLARTVWQPASPARRVRVCGSCAGGHAAVMHPLHAGPCAGFMHGPTVLALHPGFTCQAYIGTLWRAFRPGSGAGPGQFMGNMHRPAARICAPGQTARARAGPTCGATHRFRVCREGFAHGVIWQSHRRGLHVRQCTGFTRRTNTGGSSTAPPHRPACRPVRQTMRRTASMPGVT